VKKLKVWNANERYRGQEVAVYICAYSLKDAVKLITPICGYTSAHYARNYWSPCWGNTMNGIAQERGVWVELTHGKVTRLV